MYPCLDHLLTHPLLSSQMEGHPTHSNWPLDANHSSVTNDMHTLPVQPIHLPLTGQWTPSIHQSKKRPLSSSPYHALFLVDGHPLSIIPKLMSLHSSPSHLKPSNQPLDTFIHSFQNNTSPIISFPSISL